MYRTYPSPLPGGCHCPSGWDAVEPLPAPTVPSGPVPHSPPGRTANGPHHRPRYRYPAFVIQHMVGCCGYVVDAVPDYVGRCVTRTTPFQTSPTTFPLPTPHHTPIHPPTCPHAPRHPTHTPRDPTPTHTLPRWVDMAYPVPPLIVLGPPTHIPMTIRPDYARLRTLRCAHYPLWGGTTPTPRFPVT